MCGDASGLGELRGCCRATQGGLGCAREGCWPLVGLQGCWYGCAAPRLDPAQRDDAELRADSASFIHVLGARQRARRPASSCPLQSHPCGLTRVPPPAGCFASLLGKLGKTPPVGGERLKL